MINNLDEHERRILGLVQQGMTNSKICIEANVNPTILTRIIRSIKDKLGIDTKQDLIELAKAEQEIQR